MKILRKIRNEIQMLYFRLFKPWHYYYIKSGEALMNGLFEGMKSGKNGKT